MLAVAVFVASATLVAVTVMTCCERIDAGAAYTPITEMLPTAGLSDHLTATFELPATDAANTCVFEGPSVTLPGDSATLTVGTKVTLALANFVASTTLVAVTVIACCERIDAGAVYTPAAERLPTTGLIDHVTAVFVLPETAAVNLCVAEEVRLTWPGVKATLTRGRIRNECEATGLLIASLTAMALTTWEPTIVNGAVYSSDVAVGTLPSTV